MDRYFRWAFASFLGLSILLSSIQISSAQRPIGPEWKLISSNIILVEGGENSSTTVSGSITLQATAIGGSMRKPVSSDFSVVFASSTRMAGKYNFSNSIRAGGSPDSTLHVAVAPSDPVIPENGTYIVTITGALSSNHPSFCENSPILMAIKDIDSSVGSVAISNQTAGIGDFHTDYVLLQKDGSCASLPRSTMAPIIKPKDQGDSPLACFQFTEDLSVGSRGARVVTLQNKLIIEGYDIPPITQRDVPRGVFGAATAAALAKYQGDNGLPRSGFFGPQTRAKMNANCDEESPAPPVTPRATPTPRPTTAPTPRVTSSPTPRPTQTSNPLPTSWLIITPTATPAPTPSPTQTASPTPSPTATNSPTPTPTQSSSPSPTSSGSPSAQNDSGGESFLANVLNSVGAVIDSIF